MSYNKYIIEDIAIGDEVFFDDVYSGKRLTQSNHDEYWKVHRKSGDSLLINLNMREFWSVEAKDVRMHLSMRQLPIKES